MNSRRISTNCYITDRMLTFLNAFLANPVERHLARMRETILREAEGQGITLDPARLTDVNLLKRHVLKRCIYGVDLNPMAVELAKVSLWLDCFTLGAPLSFLDHHLRCGNSLIGVTVKEVQEAIEAQQGVLFGSRFAGLMLATDLMRHVGELSDITGAQVRQSRTEYRKAQDALAPFKRILDVYTSQWFGNGVKTKVKKGQAQEPVALTFLRSHDAEAMFSPSPPAGEGGGEGGLLRKISAEFRPVAEIALRAAAERRFFHWELEFPEVFYGPRNDAPQVIERNEGAGFEAVVGNPPYDVLAAEELGYDISQELDFFENQAVYGPAIRGKKNLYKLFICRGAGAMSSRGAFAYIVPMAILGDDQAVGVRRMLLEETGLVTVEAFPQKDDPHNRVFPDAKLSTVIFVTRAGAGSGPFAVRTHPGRLIEQTSPILHISAGDILGFDPDNVPILTCTQQDWDIARRITLSPGMKRLGDYCTAYQGEVNETTDGKKGFISHNPKDGPQILRGSTICLYAVREASQGEPIYLRKDKYLAGKPDSEKARHHEQRRVGWQESSPQNNFRRIIAAPIPSGEFCNHLINYIPERESGLPFDFILALLNSSASDWFFRLSSTNAHVSHYQVARLPVPLVADGIEQPDWDSLLSGAHWVALGQALAGACPGTGLMPRPVTEAIAEMSRRIQAIEAARELASRSDRSRLAPQSQAIQDAIDRVLFRCFGLSDDEAQYVRFRLTKML